MAPSAPARRTKDLRAAIVNCGRGNLPETCQFVGGTLVMGSQTAVPPAARLLARSAALRHLALVILFGALTALSAQIKWSLPGNPVPITGQVFMVLLAGALLGSRLGAASQLTYVAFGALGAPVFAAGSSGPAVLMGPTGGYILGFVLAAGVVGMIASRSDRSLNLALAMAAGVCAIYACGAIWLATWSHFGRTLPWSQALAQAVTLGVLPFVLPDCVKVGLAVAATRSALQD
jgi:biotin transport system substrate-specific component